MDSSIPSEPSKDINLTASNETQTTKNAFLHVEVNDQENKPTCSAPRENLEEAGLEPVDLQEIKNDVEDALKKRASCTPPALSSPSISIPSPQFPSQYQSAYQLQHRQSRLASMPVFPRMSTLPDASSSSSDSSQPLYCPCASECCHNQNCKRTFQALALGQLMSLCLCGTGIGSQMLANNKFNAPAAQSFLNYFFLAFVYGIIVFFRTGEQRSFFKVLRLRGWKYLLLAFIDVEANYFIVYAYQFTNLTSIQLLDCFTIPVVMLLSWLFLSVRYMVSHITGVAICLIGIVLIIYTDAAAGKGLEGGSNRVLGDLLCLGATILYGIANVCEEFLVKQNDRIEYLGMVGLFGSIICGTQLAIFEHSQLANFQWTSNSIAMYMLFTICMFCFYSLVTVVMQKTSALMFNLSVLTADFYSLMAGIYLFGMVFQTLYFVSFVVVLLGSSVYSYQKTREKSRKERECLCRTFGFCCPWVPLCCGDCRPKADYTPL
uniref:Solute carrier family 35 member F1 n=1 Tax=Ditylenchus dipsaci TaxID=166011 RepID=A0A915DA54_9BILA